MSRRNFLLVKRMNIKPSSPIPYVPLVPPLTHPDRHRETRREAELKLKTSQKLVKKKAQK